MSKGTERIASLRRRTPQ